MNELAKETINALDEILKTANIEAAKIEQHQCVSKIATVAELRFIARLATEFADRIEGA